MKAAGRELGIIHQQCLGIPCTSIIYLPKVLFATILLFNNTKPTCLSIASFKINKNIGTDTYIFT
jgi:hypothetical protein